MLGASLRALARMVFVGFGISVLVFLIFYATPGVDPAARLAGRGASQETLRAARHELGLDRALPAQYLLMMRRLFVSRDLASYVNRGERVVPAVAEAAPVTLSLVAGAAVLWVLGGVLAGVLAARRPNGVADRVIMVLCLVGVSVPVFWAGQMINLVTQSRLHDTALFAWVPPPGYRPLGSDPLGWVAALAVPWVTLAIPYAGLYGRVLRASLLETAHEDYVRTARAKGVSERRILLRHVLRASLATTVAMFGLDLGALVGGGALLTEIVFDLHGIGKLTYEALQQFDMPMVMANVLYASFFVVAASAAAEIAHAALDPRARGG